jgi:hypothetical protein
LLKEVGATSLGKRSGSTVGGFENKRQSIKILGSLPSPSRATFKNYKTSMYLCTYAMSIGLLGLSLYLFSYVLHTLTHDNIVDYFMFLFCKDTGAKK